MNKAADILRKTYRKVVPAAIDQCAAVRKLKNFIHWHLFRHDAIYNPNFYARWVEGPAVRSSGAIADSIVTEFHPRAVIDVGCGTGALLDALRNRGCQVSGLEYAEAGLAYCRQRQLDVQKFDLGHDCYAGNRSFDVAVSLEVAEHLPEKWADRYVDLLAHLSGVVVLTAAPPGDGGTDHINEQPPAYWIAKFRDRGFAHDERLSSRWKAAWKAAGVVESWYYQNLMVFRRMETIQGR